METWVGWEYRAFEGALNRMEVHGLYPLVKDNRMNGRDAAIFFKLMVKTDFNVEENSFLQPDRLKQLLEQYFEHFNQQPKNIDAYSRFLSKQLCFGHDWVEQEHHTDGIWECEHACDMRKPKPYLKPLKEGLRVYLLEEYFSSSWRGHYSTSEDLFKLCLQYGIVNRRTLPSISDILSDFDKVWTVMEINAGFYSYEDIEDEQTVLQRHKLRTEAY